MAEEGKFRWVNGETVQGIPRGSNQPHNIGDCLTMYKDRFTINSVSLPTVFFANSIAEKKCHESHHTHNSSNLAIKLICFHLWLRAPVNSNGHVRTLSSLYLNFTQQIRIACHP